MSDGWCAPGVSPFLTERARARAPRILAYAAEGGIALLFAPSGELVMSSGATDGVALAEVRRVAMLTIASRRRSFGLGSARGYVVPVTAGWTLCVVSTDIQIQTLGERADRAGEVMALALLDGARPTRTSGPGPDGAPSAAVAIRKPGEDLGRRVR